ncbi:MAG: SCE4755 family polysaccharide monooxygenase-like protein [Polyangiaceae bacterium]
MASSRSQRRRVFAAGFTAISLAFLAAAPSANAHFVLVAPGNWLQQDMQGIPIKLGPCGDEQDEAGTAVPTGTVTAYQEGTQLTVTINEVIFHPGFYRIALATDDRSQFPPEPKVDAGATECGSTTFENPPVFPVLADDVFEHATAFSTPQTTTVTLPAGVTCEHCTLQVIEFMSDHALNSPGGCFYHHCADLKIQSGPVSSTDGGGQVISGNDGGTSGTTSPEASTLPDGDPDLGSSSSGCSTPGGKAPVATGFVAMIFALLLGRGLRRRR